MTRIVSITTHARTGTLEIDERNDRVFLALTFDKYGDFGDLAEITKQLAREIIRFDGDGGFAIVRGADAAAKAIPEAVMFLFIQTHGSRFHRSTTPSS